MAEGEYFPRAVAVLAQGGEEKFQSKKEQKKLKKCCRFCRQHGLKYGGGWTA